MANNPVNWFEIYVQDMDRAKAFYEREKMSIGQYGYVVLATDPDGNMIGLHSGN